MIEKNKFWGKIISEQVKILNDYAVGIPYALIKGEPFRFWHMEPMACANTAI